MSLKSEKLNFYIKKKDEDPVRSVNFWPAGSGSGTISSEQLEQLEQQQLEQNITRINKFKLKILVYKIEFNAYLPIRIFSTQLSRIRIRGKNVKKKMPSTCNRISEPRSGP